MEQKLEEINKALQETHNFQHHCDNDGRITRLEEKVKTIFLEQEKANETLQLINTTQIQLLQEITQLNSIINTLKWTIGILIAVFGGVFVFILSEIIKLI